LTATPTLLQNTFFKTRFDMAQMLPSVWTLSNQSRCLEYSYVTARMDIQASVVKRFCVPGTAKRFERLVSGADYVCGSLKLGGRFFIEAAPGVRRRRGGSRRISPSCRSY